MEGRGGKEEEEGRRRRRKKGTGMRKAGICEEEN